MMSTLQEQVAQVIWHDDWAYAADIPVSDQALALVSLMLDRVPDGWAKVDGRWVEVEKCDTDCSEHYDGRHLTAHERL